MLALSGRAHSKDVPLIRLLRLCSHQRATGVITRRKAIVQTSASAVRGNPSQNTLNPALTDVLCCSWGFLAISLICRTFRVWGKIKSIMLPTSAGTSDHITNFLCQLFPAASPDRERKHLAIIRTA